MKIFKIIVILMILVFTAMFFIENMDPVPMYVPILRVRKVGLVFIMLVSYLFGMLTAFALITAIGAKAKKRRKLQELEAGHEELFEDE